MARRPGEARWHGEAEADDGDAYWFVVDGVGPLLDPDAMDVDLTPTGPRSVIRTRWPKQPSLGHHHDDPVVYELHVRGFGRTFAGCVGRLAVPRRPRRQRDRADAGAPVRPERQLLGLHAAGVGRGAPAVRRGRRCPGRAGRAGRGRARARARGVARCRLQPHRRRRRDDADAVAARPRRRQRLPASRRRLATTTTAGVATSSTRAIRTFDCLVLSALDRFADLGIDGFRFDLASLLTRDGGGLVDRITQWGRRSTGAVDRRAVGSCRVPSGREWPAPWLQWNDRFRDEVRGFLRGEPGLVPAVMQRVQGSPDLFADGAGWQRQLPHGTRRPDHARPDDGDQRSPSFVGLRRRAAAATTARTTSRCCCCRPARRCS